ncbi:helix-turn-helix transcriptional regulator [Paenibacillus sp. KACC 21273]|uniref:helix-turn-helix domain-containing protein n=1 Tax=Paenibacillus sp. KACC 21273 TaxID=3025665 RepID=UPI0023666679|nr:helix-turn-helix transcriptional regulator [Paenibacillus sp. KACC 21273]WDF52855.1 helix-turn-helix transcriptional regulator [Paenibacillus sp. KACC 21273]
MVKELRQEKKYTQEYMATRLGYSTANYSHKETGRRNISADELQKIAEALEVEPEIFFDQNKYYKYRCVGI